MMLIMMMTTARRFNQKVKEKQNHKQEHEQSLDTRLQKIKKKKPLSHRGPE
jgi:hypothetical protein